VYLIGGPCAGKVQDVQENINRIHIRYPSKDGSPGELVAVYAPVTESDKEFGEWHWNGERK